MVALLPLQQAESLILTVAGGGQHVAPAQFADQASDRRTVGADGGGQLRMGDANIDQHAIWLRAAKLFGQDGEDAEQTVRQIRARLHRRPGLHLPEPSTQPHGKVGAPAGRFPRLAVDGGFSVRSQLDQAIVLWVRSQKLAGAKETEQHFGAIGVDDRLRYQAFLDFEDRIGGKTNHFATLIEPLDGPLARRARHSLPAGDQPLLDALYQQGRRRRAGQDQSSFAGIGRQRSKLRVTLVSDPDIQLETSKPERGARKP